MRTTCSLESLAAQRVSFAYGNVKIEVPRVTREMAEDSARRIVRQPRR